MPPLFIALNLPVVGATRAVLRACKIVASIELSYLKRDLGLEGAGRRPSFLTKTEAGKAATWAEVCDAEAGITDDTAKNWLGNAEALKNRLSGSKWEHAQSLMRQMERRPSSLSEAERNNMVECIAAAICDSPGKLLLKEFRAVEACDIPESMSEADAKIKKQEAILVVMKQELKERQQSSLRRLVLQAFNNRRAMEQRGEI